MNQENRELFWYWVNERHTIAIMKDIENRPPPWSHDPIFQQYKFTNVFREWDRTTLWFKRHVRDPLKTSPEVLMATIIFRWFNYIRTGLLLGVNDLYANWDSEHAKYVLQDQPKWVTGSYIIKTPDGMDKLEGVCWCVDQIWPHQDELRRKIIEDQTLQNAHKALMKFPYMGPFMAYEVVTDLRHTYLLKDAPDIMTWANPGPGAKRGLRRIWSGDPKGPNPANNECNHYMQRLLQDARFWVGDHIPELEMRDIEHSLCEFDKYARVKNGEGYPRNRYNGGPRAFN